MSFRNNLRHYGLNAAVMGLLAAPMLSFAQSGDPVDAAVALAFSTATTKIGTYAAGLIGVAVIGVGVAIGIKYVKKTKGAA